ncbi:unnamed protein product [Thlaspi arvense]|uniref:F-box protein At5g52880-like ARM repeats region domain-containing protein n=1 Tax=Thlaspi arvense TaxID=13288 RepID=A0AAU9SRA0_THLAR|nr:unnamed protein product [Thlaspi arvense]
MLDVNTSAAVSATELLLKSVEAEFPKQKKKLAIVEFKKTKVALKRRSKSHEEDMGNIYLHFHKISSFTSSVSSMHRPYFLHLKCLEDKSSKVIRSGRGYCDNCNSIVWHDNLKCSKKQCRLMNFGKEPLEPMSTQRVVNYLLGTYSSSDDSDSDDEAIPGGPGLWAYPTLH